MEEGKVYPKKTHSEMLWKRERLILKGTFLKPMEEVKTSMEEGKISMEKGKVDPKRT